MYSSPRAAIVRSGPRKLDRQARLPDCGGRRNASVRALSPLSLLEIGEAAFRFCKRVYRLQALARVGVGVGVEQRFLNLTPRSAPRQRHQHHQANTPQQIGFGLRYRADVQRKTAGVVREVIVDYSELKVSGRVEGERGMEIRCGRVSLLLSWLKALPSRCGRCSLAQCEQVVPKFARAPDNGGRIRSVCSGFPVGEFRTPAPMPSLATRSRCKRRVDRGSMLG